MSRGLAGRTPIVPEPAKSVKDQIECLLRRSNPHDIQNILNEGDKEALIGQMSGWNTLLSGTLAGISDHMLTLAHGMHLIPDLNAASTALYDRDPFVSPQARLYLGDRRTMGVTPYGQVPVDGLSAHFEGESSATMFRPVTHGQVRFTKFNVVDKFGQVICAIDYRGRSKNKLRDKMFPRVSNTMACQREPTTQLPLTPEAEAIEQTEFFQLAPRINQKVRLNAHFVVPEESSQGWRAAQESENPVWAWLVINFKDTSLQIYQGDGKFQGELLIGVGDYSEWLNLSNQKDNRVTISKDSQDEIERLMFKLQDERNYRDNVWKMLIDANENIHHAPSSYGDFLPALLGRPMALVHTGFSLELAHEPMRDQSQGVKPSTADPSVKDLLDYEFQIKIGHKHSLHDGFVALVPQVAEAEKASQKDLIRFEYEKMYTYFEHGQNIADGDKPSPLVLPTILCALKPYFIDPGNFSATAQSIAAFQQQHYKKLRVFTAIIDAFQPIHIFSGILPMQKLQIPPWILEQTLEKMVIVFRAGPLLIPGDIPTPAAIEAATNAVSDKNPNVTRAHIKIPLDAPSAGNWRWIQPVRDDKGNHSHQSFETKTMDRSFHLPHGVLRYAKVRSEMLLLKSIT